MTSRHYLEIEHLGHFRPYIPLSLGYLGQCRKDVELSGELSHALQTPDMSADSLAQRLEDLPLTLFYSLSGGENLFLELLQRRRYISLCARQCLSSLVVTGNQMHIAVRDLDEIPEYPVVADLERAY